MFSGKPLSLKIGPLFLLAAAAHAGTIELGLKDALDRAAEANFQILLGREAVVSQEQSTRISRSGLLPAVGLEVTQGRTMSPVIDPVWKSIPDIPSRFYGNRFDALLRARLALLDIGAIDDFRVSKLTLAATRWQLEDTVQQILQQIATAYLTHWRNVERMAVLDSILERDRLLLQIARDQQQAGVATDLEVTRAEVQLSTNELLRIQQETSVLHSALELKRILNLPLADELVLTLNGSLQELPAAGFSDPRFAEILAARPDFKRIQTELEREQLASRAARHEHLPSLELSGQWGYAAEQWAEDAEEQWAIQLGLSMPVFEGFRIDANKRVADSALRRKEIELADLRSRIEADYRLVIQQVESSARQVEVARRARDLSRREFDLERIRFEEGVADNSQVVIAQTALTDAEDSLVEAQFQYYLARINQARIEGDVRRLVQ